MTEKNTVLIPIKNCRSRHAKFVSLYYCNYLEFKSNAIRRDREPSRLPVKQLARAFNKSRLTRRANVPRSSYMHSINRCSLSKKLHVDEDNRCLCKPRKNLRSNKQKQVNESVDKKSEFGLKNSSCGIHDLSTAEYKSLNQRIIYCYYCL